ncbi:MAG: NfeD family protein [Thermoplasmata archaeon]|nr:MAG: NfeD family protein [Thermoplasmata archaeon]
MAINSIGLIIFVIGIALIIAEAFTPGTFILVPGVALTIVGALIMAFPAATDSYWLPVIFIVSFIPAFLLAFFVYKHIAPPGRPTTLSSDSLVGRVGFVKKDIHPGNIRGKVNIENEIWSATSDTVIPEGTRVEVVKVQGVKVIVRPVEKKVEDKWVEDVLEVEA